MNRLDTLKIMAILKASYPSFYRNIPTAEYDGIAAIWQESFSDVPYEMVAISVKSLIRTHSGYPPDIAAVYAEIKSVTAAASGEPTDEELWHIYKRAVQESGYCENETFEKLPPILQRYCGSARTLHEHAMTSMETFNTVIHGQFLKQLPTIRQRQEYHDSLPEGIREMIAAGVRKMPELEKPKTPQELNDKRNKIAAQLVSPILADPPKSEYVPLSPEEKEKRKQKLLNRLS